MCDHFRDILSQNFFSDLGRITHHDSFVLLQQDQLMLDCPTRHNLVCAFNARILKLVTGLNT